MRSDTNKGRLCGDCFYHQATTARSDASCHFGGRIVRKSGKCTCCWEFVVKPAESKQELTCGDCTYHDQILHCGADPVTVYRRKSSPACRRLKLKPPAKPSEPIKGDDKAKDSEPERTCGDCLHAYRNLNGFYACRKRICLILPRMSACETFRAKDPRAEHTCDECHNPYRLCPFRGNSAACRAFMSEVVLDRPSTKPPCGDTHRSTPAYAAGSAVYKKIEGADDKDDDKLCVWSCNCDQCSAVRGYYIFKPVSMLSEAERKQIDELVEMKHRSPRPFRAPHPQMLQYAKKCDGYFPLDKAYVYEAYNGNFSVSNELRSNTRPAKHLRQIKILFEDEHGYLVERLDKKDSKGIGYRYGLKKHCYLLKKTTKRITIPSVDVYDMPVFVSEFNAYKS